MTAATLFTPNIPPKFDEMSDHMSDESDFNRYVLEADAEEGSNEDIIDEQSTDSQSPTESAAFRKLQKKLRRQVSWAIRDFNMIEDGDVVMVCFSGGKDSYTLLDILLLLKRIAPIHFDIVAVNLDQKQPGYPEDILPAYLNEQGIAHYILEKDTYSIGKSVVSEGKTYCSVCSRLRRGSL